MYNKVKFVFLLLLASFMIYGCRKNENEEAVNIEFEHYVLESKPSITPTPTPVNEDNNIDIDKDDTNSQDIDAQDETGIFEIDGMKFTSVNDMVKVIASSANLRKGPSTRYDKVTLSKAGDIFTRTAIGDGEWDQLQYQGESVYIFNEFIQKIETVNKVNINGQAGWIQLAYCLSDRILF